MWCLNFVDVHCALADVRTMIFALSSDVSDYTERISSKKNNLIQQETSTEPRKELRTVVIPAEKDEHAETNIALTKPYIKF